jgi:hypothetical protein
MLRHIIRTAQASGMVRLSLETGSWDYFRPAQGTDLSSARRLPTMCSIQTAPSCLSTCEKAEPRAKLISRRVQYASHLGGEGCLGERLLDQLHAGIEASLMHDGVARVAGHEQNADAGPELLNLR